MRFLITAGPTREAIDPVRYISNHSSGRMGYALAEMALKHGHEVLLISGPTQLDVPHGVDFIPVESAQDMCEAVQHYASSSQIAIFCAAVADYRPVHCAPEKIKKQETKLVLELERTQDILGSMRTLWGYQGVLIGFAAETQNIEDYARGKLERKGCNMVVANDVSRTDIGFHSTENEVLCVYPAYTDLIEKASKAEIAAQIIHRACEIHKHLAAEQEEQICH